VTRRINLIADLLLATEPPPSPWTVLSLTGAALVIPLLVWGVHVRAASRLDPQVVELRAARDRLAGEGDQARRLIADVEAQNARRVLEQAQAEQINWREAFRELTLVVPNGMWLSDLGREGVGPQGAESGSDAGDIPIRIRGLAVSQGVVADLLVNLETSTHFGSPTVMYTQREQGQGVGRVGFEIQCALRRIPIVDGQRAGGSA
jgi:Tfp pilus assembly protein PilN